MGIGSTAVIGLAAKPVIDILIEVACLIELDRLDKKVAALGFLVKGENGIPGRRYFQKGGNKRSHHVHAFETGDSNLIRHRAFKNYLTAHPVIASQYGRLKQQAAQHANHNINSYMALKNDFISQHESLAVEWFKCSIAEQFGQQCCNS